MTHQRIEDYALIGNCASAALVGRNGSIDWLCFPRFDSPACFAALLGKEENGRWLIAPVHAHPQVKRDYREGTLILETEFTTPEGSCVLTDSMDREDDVARVHRIVRGLCGSVALRMELLIRFDYGSTLPWVSRLSDGRLRAIAGPDMLVLDAEVETRGEDMKTVAEFTVTEGNEFAFALSWRASHKPIPERPDARARTKFVASLWLDWSATHTPPGKYADAILRALITLKALTHFETGGIVAAVTTSLPESLGGQRNWDYRYCWLRDATFTLYSLLRAGFTEEARSWRNWLVRAVAGDPAQMQIMYGLAGERRLTEFEIPWLSGYEGSKPVRIGNAASEQVQLDVYGEVLDLLYQSRRAGIQGREAGWEVERALVNHLTQIWQKPDAGLWEVRGPNRDFTHSKVMAWIALDRGVRIAEEFGLDCPAAEWRKTRDRIHREVCEKGYNRKLNSFVQYFGGDTLDASLLMIPMTGFLPPEDPRMKGTVAAIEKYLVKDGFVQRYNTRKTADGVGGREGAFLACSFWLADNYVLQGRRADAETLFERLLGLRNDVGLLAEEYDVGAKRQAGNFPQAFSLVSLINTAYNLSSETTGPARDRSAQRAEKC